MKNKKGFSLMEVLITIVLVAVLSALCAMMLLFSYSMFKKVASQGSTSTEYKTFRLKIERIFRGMTKDGPVIGDRADLVEVVKPYTEDQEDNCIKFDKGYYMLPYIETKTVKVVKYTDPAPAYSSTKYRVEGSSSNLGNWEGHVGRSVSIYSLDNTTNPPAYKRYLLQREHNTDLDRYDIVLYEWPAVMQGDILMPITSTHSQASNYSNDAAIRDIVLKNVSDFQVTARLSNLYTNRITLDPYSETAAVRIFTKMRDSSSEYTNDLIFTNKSVYGDMDKFFVTIDPARVNN